MLFRYVGRVFHSTPLVLVATFTFLLLLAVQARFVGIPLAAIIVSWFFKYLFVMLDAVIAGNDATPVLSVEMVNPFDEQRPFGQALLIVAGVMLVVAARLYVGLAPAYVLGAALLFCLPASIAVLGISGNLFHAAWPPAWIQVIRGLGWDYVGIIVGTLAAVVILYGLISLAAPTWIGIAALQIFFMAIFVLIGGAVFEHRLDLGLESRTPQERLAERDRREHSAARQHTIDHAYEYFRHSKPTEGWQEIQAWLTAHAQGNQQLIEYHAMLDAASGWDDIRPADKLANELIAVLLAKKQTGAALEVAETRLASNPGFRPVNSTRLAELASLAGKRGLARKLATDVASL